MRQAALCDLVAGAAKTHGLDPANDSKTGYTLSSASREGEELLDLEWPIVPSRPKRVAVRQKGGSEWIDRLSL